MLRERGGEGGREGEKRGGGERERYNLTELVRFFCYCKYQISSFEISK